NGAGKSTLIRMVMDILRPDSGEIRILGAPPRVNPHVGYLPEERGLYQRHRVDQYLDRVGLLETKKKRMRELSKGMQQKVQIAAVLLGEPELMVLDEPFEGLDPVNRVLINDLMKEFAAK